MIGMKVFFKNGFFFGKQMGEFREEGMVLIELFFGEAFFEGQTSVSGMSFRLLKNLSSVCRELKKNSAFVVSVFVGEAPNKTLFFQRAKTLAEIGFETIDGNKKGTGCRRRLFEGGENLETGGGEADRIEDITISECFQYARDREKRGNHIDFCGGGFGGHIYPKEADVSRINSL